MTWSRVFHIEELKEGRGRTMEVGDHSIAFFRQGDEVRAINDFCRHRGGHLGEGPLEDGIVLCPLHGWRYELLTGKCLSHPQGDVAVYPVEVRDHWVYVDTGDGG